MADPLVIIGCGGFGREVFSLVQALAAAGAGWQVEGFVDDDPSPENARLVRALASRVIGPLDAVADRAAAELRSGRGALHAVIAIGSPGARAAVAARLHDVPLRWPVLIHPDSTLGREVTVGDGSVIAPGARLSTNITIGRHVHVDQNAAVGHDSRIGDFARLNPQACISGSVQLDREVLIGANSTVLQGLRVGARSVVGAGACVTKDVPEGRTVKGVPAR
jgi:sugar O-acyltransferase (sialic acid O-acetyltransferase NeuD family)